MRGELSENDQGAILCHYMLKQETDVRAGEGAYVT